MTHLDLRVSKTLQQIDNSLLDNLDKYPFKQITIDLLCRSAMINRSTFYKYYTDKYDLLDKYLDRILKNFKDTANCSFANSPMNRIDNVVYYNQFKHFAEHASIHKNEYLILWHATMERNIFTEMTEIIYDEFLEELPDYHSCSPQKIAHLKLYARLFSSNCMTLLKWYFENDDIVNIQEMRDIMNKNMKKGLFSAFYEYCNAT